MTIFELWILAAELAMDSFAISVSGGILQKRRAFRIFPDADASHRLGGFALVKRDDRQYRSLDCTGTARFHRCPDDLREFQGVSGKKTGY